MAGGGVARQLQTAAGMRPPRALPPAKKLRHLAQVIFDGFLTPDATMCVDGAGVGGQDDALPDVPCDFSNVFEVIVHLKGHNVVLMRRELHVEVDRVADRALVRLVAEDPAFNNGTAAGKPERLGHPDDEIVFNMGRKVDGKGSPSCSRRRHLESVVDADGMKVGDAFVAFIHELPQIGDFILKENLQAISGLVVPTGPRACGPDILVKRVIPVEEFPFDLVMAGVG